MLLLLLALSAPLVQDWTPPPPPPTVPSVAMAQPRFSPFVLPDGLRVVTQVAELEPLAGVLAELLSARLGREVVLGAPPARSGDVVLTLGYTADEVGEGPEALSIEVFEDHVALSGRTPDGVARAAARMLQLLTPTPAEDPAGAPSWALPAVRLDDAPRFTWRAVRVVGDLELASTQRLLDLLFLGSFNALVLEGVSGVGEGWQARQQARQLALVKGLAVDAKARGISVVVDRSSQPMPFARADEGASLRPLLCRPGDPANLAPFIEAGRSLVGASRSWRPGLEVADPVARTSPEGAAYSWSPLGFLGAADSDLAKAASPLVIGSELEVRGAEGVQAFARVLPCLSERAWGAASAPEVLSDFRPRAVALTSLVELFGAAHAASSDEAHPGGLRRNGPDPRPGSGR
ncbi:glycoside hydrolase family 20 zincin-like fold domain-containing protein [bacterium]|nr:glycoside hydrolase family 20 zincin-like fold domain-containing protein [Planctomycetota bacterium]MDB4489466.1 glycoside hydrolase family 20 zincin-like fold domain-containing protein [bacterium]